MKTKNHIGLMYFIVHFIIEITCYYIAFSYVNDAQFMILAFLYDMLAFIPEGFYGMLNDIGLKIHFGYVGMIIAGAALLMFAFDVKPVIAIVTVAIGNGMIHVQGAQMTLRSSGGKMFPSALYVAGGSFGVVTGRLLASGGVPVVPVIIIHCLMIIPIILADKQKEKVLAGELTDYNYADEKTGRSLVIGIAVCIVILRAYMGSVVPTSWNDDSVTLILLFSSLGLGKALGGYLIDKIGMRITVFISTICSLPFLIFGDKLMVVSLIGLMLFSMTMAVALGLLVSVMKEYPGLAFGLTTVGLFFGVFIAAFIKFDDLFVNCVSLAVMTLISYFALRLIVRKDRKNGSN